MADPDKKSKVTVNGKDFTVTSKQLAERLISAKVWGSKEVTSSAYAVTFGGGVSERRSGSSKNEITIYGALFKDSPSPISAIAQTFIHESFHLSPEERGALLPMYRSDPDKFNADHQEPYNDKARDLYEWWK